MLSNTKEAKDRLSASSKKHFSSSSPYFLPYFALLQSSDFGRHAQIDLFTWRKWIRVGISTLQPLKVQGGQNTRFFLVCKNLTFNFYTEKGILISNKIGKLPSSLLNFDFCAQNITEKWISLRKVNIPAKIFFPFFFF